MMNEILTYLYGELLELCTKAPDFSEKEYYKLWPNFDHVKTSFSNMAIYTLKEVYNHRRNLFWSDFKKDFLSLDRVIFETPQSQAHLPQSIRYIRPL